jgi:hypothetical protein
MPDKRNDSIQGGIQAILARTREPPVPPRLNLKVHISHYVSQFTRSGQSQRFAVLLGSHGLRMSSTAPLLRGWG